MDESSSCSLRVYNPHETHGDVGLSGHLDGLRAAGLRLINRQPALFLGATARRNIFQFEAIDRKSRGRCYPVPGVAPCLGSVRGRDDRRGWGGCGGCGGGQNSRGQLRECVGHKIAVGAHHQRSVIEHREHEEGAISELPREATRWQRSGGLRATTKTSTRVKVIHVRYIARVDSYLRGASWSAPANGVGRVWNLIQLIEGKYSFRWRYSRIVVTFSLAE